MPSLLLPGKEWVFTGESVGDWTGWFGVGSAPRPAVMLVSKELSGANRLASERDGQDNCAGEISFPTALKVEATSPLEMPSSGNLCPVVGRFGNAADVEIRPWNSSLETGEAAADWLPPARLTRGGDGSSPDERCAGAACGGGPSALRELVCARASAGGAWSSTRESSLSGATTD
jgi:hypothetical protein